MAMVKLLPIRTTVLMAPQLNLMVRLEKAEDVRIGVAVDGVGEKETTEEQNFGDKKGPHAERGGFLLLLERLKLARQFSGAVHSVLLFDFRSRRADCRGAGGAVTPTAQV